MTNNRYFHNMNKEFNHHNKSIKYLVYFILCRYKESQLNQIKANRVKTRGAKLLVYMSFSDGIGPAGVIIVCLGDFSC